MNSRFVPLIVCMAMLMAPLCGSSPERKSFKERRQERLRKRTVKQMRETYPSAKDRWPLSPKTGRAQKHTLEHDDREREYYVYAPPGLDREKPAPLFFVIHGGGGTARNMEIVATNRRFNRLADRHGFIVVYPQGVDKSWNDGRQADIIKADKLEVDDVGFFKKMIEKVSNKWNVDGSRIGVTGMSNGGFMSFRLARELSGTVTAAAPVTATIPAASFAEYELAAPVSLLLINGTEDPLVPYEGGAVKAGRRQRGKTVSTENSVKKFAALNGCNQKPEECLLEDRVPADGLRINRRAFAGCNEGARVVLLSVIGGGHTWPGGIELLPERIVGKTCHDISATDYIVEFFLESG